MKNTFVDNKDITGEINSALDFVTVRNSNRELVFMGERKNIKCFDRLKKISDRVFETVAGQTYRFLDKMPEPEKPKEPEMPPEMLKRAEAAWAAHCMERPAPPVQAAKPLPFEEQLQHDWRFNPNIRADFVSFGSYQAFMRAKEAGKVKLFGCKS